jgi:hypothetical protein
MTVAKINLYEVEIGLNNINRKHVPESGGKWM